MQSRILHCKNIIDNMSVCFFATVTDGIPVKVRGVADYSQVKLLQIVYTWEDGKVSRLTIKHPQYEVRDSPYHSLRQCFLQTGVSSLAEMANRSLTDQYEEIDTFSGKNVSYIVMENFFY